jgi:hypothetical protein
MEGTEEGRRGRSGRELRTGSNGLGGTGDGGVLLPGLTGARGGARRGESAEREAGWRIPSHDDSASVFCPPHLAPLAMHRTRW